MKISEMLKVPDQGQGPVYQECMSTYNEFQQRKINASELEYHMADVSMTLLDTIVQIPAPRMPQILQKYYNDIESYEWKRLSVSEKSERRAKVFKIDEISKYMESSQKVRCENLARVWRLESLMKLWMDIDEWGKCRLCWDRYKLFPSSIESGGNIIWKSKTIKELEAEI